ncbi:MAG: S8 family peptidase [Woeseiaceae bacterium]|nr:S8 family peptidase [Woeseiaceae bacterium]
MGSAALISTASAGGPDPATTSLSSPQSNQIIIKYKTGGSAQISLQQGQISAAATPAARAAAVSTAMGVNASHVRRIATGADVFRLETWRSHSDLQKRLLLIQADPAVEYAEVDALLQPMATPNDSRYNEQWHYFESTGGMNLPTAWDTTTGTGTVVAVLDTGYRPHVDLAANLLPGYDMIVDTFVSVDGNGRDADATDPGDWSSANQCGFGSPARSSSWHGTHVAGTIAAVTNNGSGVAGVAYGAKIVPVRVLGRCGGYTSDIADGIVWASGGTVSGVPANANPADVLNLSLGGGGSCPSTTQAAVNTARANGSIVVVAAGNSNANAANYTPASCSGVISVAATNRNGGKSYYSNYGSVVDFAAPGGDVTTGSQNGVLSTLNSGSSSPGADNYAFYQGTSMAAPHIAGLAALMRSVDPSLTPDQVESTIASTARAFPATCSQCGAGIADAAAAIAAISGGPPPPPPPPPPGATPLINDVPETGLSGTTGDELMFTLEVPETATSLSFSISGGSGDADLYVRFGEEPTTTTYDCRPWLNGNNETCTISNIQPGTYYVMVRAYSSFSGVSLVGSYSESSGSAGGSFSESNLSASRRAWLRYTIEVPEGMSTLTVAISGGTGDADLYVRYGSQPSTRSYNCRPYRNGNNETCTFNNPQPGTWHIGIRAYRSFSGVNLDAEWSP